MNTHLSAQVTTFVVMLVCHVIGDFLFQNHWMQEKSRSHAHCAIHIAFYAVPFLVCIEASLLPHGWLVALVLAEHYLQDRYALHLKWMKLIQQTPPTIWPAGPLFVDQAWHVASMAILALLFV